MGHAGVNRGRGAPVVVDKPEPTTALAVGSFAALKMERYLNPSIARSRESCPCQETSLTSCYRVLEVEIQFYSLGKTELWSPNFQSTQFSMLSPVRSCCTILIAGLPVSL